VGCRPATRHCRFDPIALDLNLNFPIAENDGNDDPAAM
jgi:hypothetical protein